MPRRLLLGIIILFSSVAFLAGNLWASNVSSKNTAKTKKQAEVKPYSSLAKVIKATQKKTLKSTKMSVKKKTPTIKSAHKATHSKKVAGVKTRSPKKSAYLKAKSQQKTARYKKQACQHTQSSTKPAAAGKAAPGETLSRKGY